MEQSPITPLSEKLEKLLDFSYLEVEELILLAHPNKYSYQRIDLEGEGPKRIGRSYVLLLPEEIISDSLYQQIENMINPEPNEKNQRSFFTPE